jgi:hypothetical protein
MMAVFVINSLEVIDIDESQGKRCTCPLSLENFGNKIVLELSFVVQTGETV